MIQEDYNEEIQKILELLKNLKRNILITISHLRNTRMHIITLLLNQWVEEETMIMKKKRE